MGYSVWVSVDTGSGNTLSTDSKGYTYNCSPMFYKALSTAVGRKDTNFGISELDGLRCEEAYPILQKAVQHMVKNADWYKKHNPKNGWGNYDGALRFLAWICQQAKDHPLGVIKVC